MTHFELLSEKKNPRNERVSLHPAFFRSLSERRVVSLFKQRCDFHFCSLQKQKEIPSSGSHRGEDLGASQEEGSGDELATQCDTHARIFLFQESLMHQFRTNEVSDRKRR